MGKTPERDNISFWGKGNIPWISISDMKSGKVLLSTKEKITEKAFKEKFDSMYSVAGTLIMSFKLTVGKTSILGIDAVHNEAIISIFPYLSYDNIIRDYLLKTLEGLVQFVDKRDAIKGITLNSKKLDKMLIPLPPIEEQRRLLDFWTKTENEIINLEQNQTDYISLTDSLKKAILQSAIQGTLVEQCEDDEPASILLEKIREEKKAQLGKKYVESYIYKGVDNRYYEKNGSETQEITEEIPFDIPQSWEWCRASNCILPMESQKPQGGSFQYIDIDAIDNKKQIVRMPKTVETSKAPSRASRKVHEGDTLFSMVRPYLKNIAFIDELLKDCIASTGFYVCQPDRMLYPRYLFLILISSYFIDGVMEFMKGDNSPSIRTENLENMLLPIPPLMEQERIVNIYNSIILSIKDED